MDNSQFQIFLQIIWCRHSCNFRFFPLYFFASQNIELLGMTFFILPTHYSQYNAYNTIDILTTSISVIYQDLESLKLVLFKLVLFLYSSRFRILEEFAENAEISPRLRTLALKDFHNKLKLILFLNILEL